VSACRSCGAPVEWVRVHPTGKVMPLDPAPRIDGNVVRTGERSWTRQGTEVDVVRVVPTGDEPLPGIDPPDRWVSHFVTCPDADSWSRRRR
jgi:hypothetical protein